MSKKTITNEDIANQIVDLANMFGTEFGKVNVRFDKMDKRFDKMDKRFDKMDKRFDKMDKRFDKSDRDSAALSSRVASLEIGQKETNKRLTRIENYVAPLEDDIKELYEMVAELQREHKKHGEYNLRTEKRIKNIENFVDLVAEKTGIPYSGI